MSEASLQSMPGPAPRRRNLTPALYALLTGALILATAALYYRVPPVGKAQPIPFSHRLHAGDKQIACFFCHTGAMATERAGVPPLQTCMQCHQRIIVDYPPIQDLRRHYLQGIPVEWERVNDVPDFVYFDHQVHLMRGVDCGTCHGDVKAMDRIVPAHELNMGFCVQCHRDNGASHDCLMCHR